MAINVQQKADVFYGRIFDYAAQCDDFCGAGSSRVHTGKGQAFEAGTIRRAFQASDVSGSTVYDLFRRGKEFDFQ